MAVSDLVQIDFRQEWFVGDALTFSSDTTNDTEEPFFYEVSLDPDLPHVEHAKVYITPTGIAGTDPTGNIEYGGNFKPDINNITVSGNLTEVQEQTILENISPNISTGNGGEDVFDFFVSPIAAVGAQFFDVTIPYEETDITNNSILVPAAFIDISSGSSAPNPLLLSVDTTNENVTLDGGSVGEILQAFRVSNIAVGREFNSATVEKQDTTFLISWEENLDNLALLTIDNDLDITPFQQGVWNCNVNYRYDIVLSESNTITTTVSQQPLREINNGETIDNLPLFTVRLHPGVEASWTTTAGNDFSLSFQGIPSWDRSFFAINMVNHHSHLQPFTVTFSSSLITIRSVVVIGQNVFDRTVNVPVSPDLAITEVLGLMANGLQIFPEWGTGMTLSLSDPMFQNATYEHVSPVTITVPYDPQFGGTPVPYVFPSQSSAVTSNIDITVTGGKDIQDVIDFIKDSFVDPNSGYGLPVQVVFQAQGVTTPSNWVSLTAASLFGGTITAGTDGAIDSEEVLLGNQYRLTTNQFVLTDYTTMQALADAVNNIYIDFDIISSPGTFFELADPTIMSRDDTIGIDSMFDDPGLVRITGEPGQVSTGSYSVNLISGFSIEDLASDINTNLPGLFSGSIVLSNQADADASGLVNAGPFDIMIPSESEAFFELDLTSPLIQVYPWDEYPTISGLVDRINEDWEDFDVTATLGDGSNNPDSVTSNLQEVIPPVDIYNTSYTMYGLIFEVPVIDLPVEDIVLSFNVRFATGGNPNDASGIQVALGGYESEGVFLPNTAPNAFFEPNFNTFFPITFNVTSANVIYLLLRTRKNLEGTVFSSNIDDYSGLARYVNNSPSESLIPYIPNDPTFTSVWTEENIGEPPIDQVPVVMAVPGNGASIDVFLEDILEQDSLNLTIINSVAALDQFGFLAINRTNLNGSMTESREGTVFGLVLDNRGAWDVLIGPEAELRQVESGNFSYLGSSYERVVLDTDEGFDFEFNDIDSLPAEVSDSISLIPVPGYPQVWALRIERGVKEYLEGIRTGQDRNSTEGCSVDINILVTGRQTQVQGICRVTIFYNVYCVFDTNICDTFWNLTEPIEPPGPDLIQNNILCNYINLIDCANLETVPSNDAIEVNVPLMLSIRNVPMFRNGNALFLVKSVYTSEIQGFYLPTGDDLTSLQFDDCSTVGNNIPLISRLNRPILYLPDQPNPVTDPFDIEFHRSNSDEFLYIRPAFQVPEVDDIKDCGPDEIVIVGIGYEFKNWTPGLREDDIVFGVTMILTNDVFVTPGLETCFRYYYKDDN